jgi:hypothetical protein
MDKELEGKLIQCVWMSICSGACAALMIWMMGIKHDAALFFSVVIATAVISATFMITAVKQNEL